MMLELIRETKSYKPLDMTIAGTSIMILPPIESLCESIATVWVGGHIYAQGSIVLSTNGRYYWAPIAGTSHATVPPAHADGDLTDGVMIWRAVRLSRTVFTLTNFADTNIYLSRGCTAEKGKGLVLGGSGALNEGFGTALAYQGAWYAIADGTTTIAISEG